MELGVEECGVLCLSDDHREGGDVEWGWSLRRYESQSPHRRKLDDYEKALTLSGKYVRESTRIREKPRCFRYLSNLADDWRKTTGV